jgi:hypothetical protein
MSKKENEITIDLSNFSDGVTETVTVESVNGISADDLITVSTDAWTVDNELVSGSITLGPYTTDTVTLKEVEFDFQNTDVKQGDLFNGWSEDGPPVTITTLKED